MSTAADEPEQVLLVSALCRFGIKQPVSDTAAADLPSSQDGECILSWQWMI